MEADWEFEIGEDAPVIDAYWPGFVDLRICPGKAADFAESHQLPGLANVLSCLNASNSRVWTCKTDVFDPGHVDPDELDAATEECGHTVACYIDLLPRSSFQWSTPSETEGDCRLICARLVTQSIRCCRVDLVIRRACVTAYSNDLGITAYLTACGKTEVEAKSKLVECLIVFANVIASMGPSSVGI